MHFKRQGNLYPSYKHHSTYKCLVGVAPNGCVMFVSDAFEGSMSDNEIVKQSGFLEYLQPGDMILADRGVTIRDILYARQVDLNIPPFLNGRASFTQEEEIKTRQIARVRIHVERAIERIKKFRLLKKSFLYLFSLSSVRWCLLLVASLTSRSHLLNKLVISVGAMIEEITDSQIHKSAFFTLLNFIKYYKW